MVTGDSANLSTLMGFAKKLVVSGQDALIRWWQSAYTERLPGPSQPGFPAQGLKETHSSSSLSWESTGLGTGCCVLVLALTVNMPVALVIVISFWAFGS